VFSEAGGQFRVSAASAASCSSLGFIGLPANGTGGFEQKIAEAAEKEPGVNESVGERSLLLLPRIYAVRMKRPWLIPLWVLAVVVVSGLGLLALLLLPRDRLFHGKLESEWIKGVNYGMSLSDEQNREQAQRWHEFGPEGLRVLERGLNPERGRRYREIYRRVSLKWPRFLVSLLPTPPMDATRGTRMNVLDLLWRMGKDAHPAWPAVARALADEDAGVRQIAITFFTHPEDDTAFLNQMRAPDKKELLPLFLRALEDNRANWGLRNNAALALKYYPEQAPRVAPALEKALQDPSPYVRLIAAEGLNRVDAEMAKKAGAVTVMSRLMQDQDDQVASRAAFVLRQFQNEPDAAVSALLQALQSTNSNVGCNAVWSLEWAFPSYAGRIIPELRKAAERKDNVGGYARSAVKHLESEAAAK
jgi:non-SMC mitotic condensation complex subunit 1